MPLDALVSGRIATLAGTTGFGWVEAIGIRDGRVAFAGSAVDLETRADPFTARIELDPGEVAVPGLTDAHLHLQALAMAADEVRLDDAPTLEVGMARVREAHDALTLPTAWLIGRGWSADRWGRWPTAREVAAAAPGRRVVLWAHDHHTVVASPAAMRAGRIDRASSDPSDGRIGRDADGEPDGLLFEGATRLVTGLEPAWDDDRLDAAIETAARSLLALGIVAVHDPGVLRPDPDLAHAFGAYARLAERGRLPVHVRASLRSDGLAAALAGGLRSGDILGGDPAGRARVGWLKLFADGTLGSGTAVLIDRSGGAAIAPGGIWNTEPAELGSLAAEAAAGGIGTQIHAIGDAAVRAALDALAPTRGVAAPMPMPRIEHIQLLDPADAGRFASSGIAASVQPIHLATDARIARSAWGARAEADGYAYGTIARSGAVMPFGTDAPVEAPDPWPGLAIAVCRTDPRWGSGAAPFGPDQAISLDRALRAATIDPAVSAGEADRGRLVPGQRADLVVIPGAALDEPVEAGGALATVRPSLVMVEGRVVVEA